MLIVKCLTFLQVKYNWLNYKKKLFFNEVGLKIW